MSISRRIGIASTPHVPVWHKVGRLHASQGCDQQSASGPRAVGLGLVRPKGRKLTLLARRLELVDVREVRLELSLAAHVPGAAVEGAAELRDATQRDQHRCEAVLVKQLMHLGLLGLHGNVLRDQGKACA